MTPTLAELAVGDALPPLTYRVTRKQLVQYAGAAGDFNAIHWNQRVAVDVGLPDVIAHGMFTMASALRIVTDWLGDRTLASGATYVLRLPAGQCVNDIRVVYDNGQASERRRVNTCSITDLVFP